MLNELWSRVYRAVTGKHPVGYLTPGQTIDLEVDGWEAKFAQQNEWIGEGTFAAQRGKVRADCPYDRETQSEAWNFWVYGCDNEHGHVAWELAGKPMAST